jgi:hypothetical protein
MAQSPWPSILKWTIKLNILIWIVNCAVFAILVVSNWNSGLLIAYFSKTLLLETGLALLIGGILAFSSSALQTKAKEYISKSEEHWSIETLRHGEKRANKFLLLAVALFIESVIVSLVGF